ncbi:DUF3794 domain-containing protein [Selenomonadales bacterium OttesenSCG-928-I06]|nr:DUF3794 domain-containing protein [Selenomonadales bacterium OttesenSCG-928-I06]
MTDKKLRAYMTNKKGSLSLPAGPQTVVVRQVIGEQERQKVLDVQIKVPERKPAIEQIVDVFVKNLKVLRVDVINDRVIVRGDLEIKAIYVAALPQQPVHAVEVKHYKFTQEVDIPGARKGMDAEANVVVEFVDYNVAEYTRAYKYKNFENMDSNCSCNSYCDSCDDYCSDDCEDTPVCDEEDTCPCEDTREFDVSIVLKIVAKVMADREVVVGYIPPAVKSAVKAKLPAKPKG